VRLEGLRKLKKINVLSGNLSRDLLSSGDVLVEYGMVSSCSQLRKRLVVELMNLKPTKNGIFWDVTPCASCKNRRFGGTWRLLRQGDKKR
jgi:hypothetical protein